MGTIVEGDGRRGTDERDEGEVRSFLLSSVLELVDFDAETLHSLSLLVSFVVDVEGRYLLEVVV